MRRASFILVGIVALQFCIAALAERQFWRYFPDGDIPKWVELLGPCNWVAIVGLLYLWCRADAKDRRVTIPVATSILVPLLFPIGVPYYYLRTYPARTAFQHIGMAVVFIACCIGVAWLGQKLVFDYIFIWTNHRRTL
jgi:hypothetical protein